jgi:hypothetical protein
MRNISNKLLFIGLLAAYVTASALGVEIATGVELACGLLLGVLFWEILSAD